MNQHEELNYKYGRSISQRVRFLNNDIINSKETEKYKNLFPFIKIYLETEGSSFNFGTPKDVLIEDKNEQALTEINKVFFDKYGLDIWHTYKNKVLVLK